MTDIMLAQRIVKVTANTSVYDAAAPDVLLTIDLSNLYTTDAAFSACVSSAQNVTVFDSSFVELLKHVDLNTTDGNLIVYVVADIPYQEDLVLYVGVSSDYNIDNSPALFAGASVSDYWTANTEANFDHTILNRAADRDLVSTGQIGVDDGAVGNAFRGESTADSEVGLQNHWSIEFWVRRLGSSAFNTIVEAPAVDWEIYSLTSYPTYQLIMWFGGYDVCRAYINYQLPPNTFVHVIFTLDFSNPTSPVHVYINGDAQEVFVVNPDNLPASMPTFDTITVANSGYGLDFDEMGLYDKEVSEEEAQYRYDMSVNLTSHGNDSVQFFTIGDSFTPADLDTIVGANIVGAIKIYLSSRYTGDTTIGLYTSETGNSELRFSEAELFGVDDTYNYQMLLRDGIGEISENVDTTTGGNNATVNDFTFSVKGTNQFFLKLAELGIELTGTRVEYIEFVGSDDDSDSVSETVMFTGSIESYSYNEFGGDITARTTFSERRKICLGERLTEAAYSNIDDSQLGKTAPVTFGRSDPDSGIYFKLPLLEYRNELITVNDLLGGYDEPKNLSSFPIVSLSSSHDSDEIAILLSEEGSEDGYNSKINYDFDGKYILLQSLDSTQTDYEGLMRAIDRGESTTFGEYEIGPPHTYDRQGIRFILKQYLPEVIIGCTQPLPAFPALPDEFPAHLNILDGLTTYALDTETCEGFVGQPSLFTQLDSEILRCTDIEILQGAAFVPIYEVAANIYYGEVGRLRSFKILPIPTITPYISPDGTLDRFIDRSPSYVQALDAGAAYEPGVFVLSVSHLGTVAELTESGATYYNDRDYTTEYSANTTIAFGTPADQDCCVVLKMTLPELTDDIQFDAVYLGIKMDCSIVPGGVASTLSGIRVCHREYYGDTVTPIDRHDTIIFTTYAVDTLPDDYYSNGPSTSNKNFYKIGEDGYACSGYLQFGLEIADRNAYKNIHEFVLILEVKPASDSGGLTLGLNITEAAIIFESETDIGQEVFA